MPPFLISLLLQFKTQIIVAIAIVGIVFGAYMYHVSAIAATRSEVKQERDFYWTALIQNSPVETKTDTTYRDRWHKDTSGVGNAIAQGVDSARKAYADSLMQLKNRDSVFYALSQKQEFKHEIKQDSAFSMDYKGEWDPLKKDYKWGISNVLTRERVITNDSKQMVPIPFKRLALHATLGGSGDLTLGTSYRLGTDKDLFNPWNNYSVGIGYQVAGPKVNDKWYTPMKVTVTGFIE